jgi:hypothetical protein
MLGPVLEHEAAAREGELVLAKVDVEANQGLAGEYGISGIPAVKAFRNGQVERVTLSRMPVAPSIDDSSSGEETATRAASAARFSPEATPSPSARNQRRA